ncbi:hypothetical protein PoB_002150100 [Plakobranchus ocellatus]|uniref:Uncharacterized protein n=1 Tax=Plakobranchus ocellatus TaxID=259542 RepID=A0AAV3ZGG0_9GAST|nr:hypothetical protein PoB_002150100 [Plakobranchus ocellatus]
MPAHIHFGPVKDKIPLNWTSLKIQDLRSTDVSRKYAHLKIKHRYKRHVCRINRLKMLLMDANDHVIDLFALGKVADDLDICENGDTILCVEFEIEECPGQCERPYQIIADDTRSQQSLIWVNF